MRIAVLGAAGMMGAVIVRDLRDRGHDDLVLLDRRRDPAAPDIAPVDARDPQALYLALEGCVLLVNAASYRVNLTAMDAALAAGCGYLDLGGLYHVTARQLERDAAWRRAGLLAVLGCGAGPGKTNLMAAWAAAELGGDVRRVRCASAGLDEAGPSLPYALQTLRDELAEAPVVRRDGAATAIEPLTPGGEVVFPGPIGARPTTFTLHSEALTIDAPDVDFRLGLMPAVQQALLDGAELPPPSPRTWSGQVVEVTTDRGAATVTALTPPHEAWGIGGQLVSTASVAAAVAHVWSRGGLGAQAGVLAPERALSLDLLRPWLEARGTTFELHHEVTT